MVEDEVDEREEFHGGGGEVVDELVIFGGGLDELVYAGGFERTLGAEKD